MKQVPITDARASLGSLANRAALRGERIALTRNGKPFAAIVPFEDAQFMEDREDRTDSIRARKMLAKNQSAIPWEQVKKELGLDAIPHRHRTGRQKAARKSA